MSFHNKFIILVYLAAANLRFGKSLGDNETSGFSKPFEYVVTDLEDVIKGAYLDRRYREPRDPTGSALTSVPGCPKSEHGHPWVLYGTVTQGEQCYLAGSQGPCAEGEVVFMEKGSPYGFCNCECFFTEGDGEKLRSSPNETWTCVQGFKRVVFVPEFKRCYYLYEQGPCPAKYWLVEDTHYNKEPYVWGSVAKTKVKCEARRCPPGQTPTGYGSWYDIDCGFIGGGGSVSVLTRKDCEAEGKAYSSLLRKCVRKLDKSTPLLMIG